MLTLYELAAEVLVLLLSRTGTGLYLAMAKERPLARAVSPLLDRPRICMVSSEGGEGGR